MISFEERGNDSALGIKADSELEMITRNNGKATPGTKNLLPTIKRKAKRVSAKRKNKSKGSLRLYGTLMFLRGPGVSRSVHLGPSLSSQLRPNEFDS